MDNPRNFSSDNRAERVSSRQSYYGNDGFNTPRVPSRLSMIHYGTDAPSNKRSFTPRNSIFSVGPDGPKAAETMYSEFDVENKWRLSVNSEDIKQVVLDFNDKLNKMKLELIDGLKTSLEKKLSSLNDLRNKKIELQNVQQKLADEIEKNKPELEAEKELVREINSSIESLKKCRAMATSQFKNLELEGMRLEQREKQQAQIIEERANTIKNQSTQNIHHAHTIEKALCLSIKKGGLNQLAFNFQYISEKDPMLTCSFTLDLSNDTFELVDCNPLIPKATEHVARLKASRSIMRFVCSMREGFQDFYKVGLALV